MAKYDGLLGQPVLEVEEPDKEGGITIILKDNRSVSYTHLTLPTKRIV